MNFGKISRLLILGGSQRAVNLIKVATGFDIQSTVVTAERYLNAELPPSKTTFKKALDALGTEYYQTETLESFKELDSLITPDTLGVSLGAPWIFKKDFIDKFQGRLINGHGAKLPADRGGGDFSWQIMRGVTFGYHLFHQIDPGIDTGDIVLYNEFIFPPACKTPLEYKKYFIDTETAFFKDFFDRVKKCSEFKTVAQQDYFSSYFPRLSTEHHGYINWSWNADEISRFITAFDDPYKGASTFYGGKRLFLKKAEKYVQEGRFHPFMSGLVYRKNNDCIFIAAPDASVIVREILDADGNDASGLIKTGGRFFTASEYLDRAMDFRAVYDAKGLKNRNSV